METNDFNLVLVKGLEECPEDLKPYLIREAKKAERKHFYSLESFVLMCRKIIATAKDELKDKYGGLQPFNDENFTINNVTKFLSYNKSGQAAQRTMLTYPICTWIENILDEMVAPEAINEVNPEPQSDVQTTLSKCGFNFSSYMKPKDYEVFIKLLESYFNETETPKLTSPIQTIGRPNRKEFGWNLKQLYGDIKGGVLDENYVNLLMNSIDLLCFNRHKTKYTYKQGYKNFTEKPETIKNYIANY